MPVGSLFFVGWGGVLVNGIVWFNIKPNYFISVNDPNLEDTIRMRIKTKDIDMKSCTTCLDLKPSRQPPLVFEGGGGGGGDAIWSKTHGTSEENDHMDIVSSSFDCRKLVPGINIYYLINETFGQNRVAIMMRKT